MKGCLKYGLNCANLGIQAVAFQQVLHSSFLLDWGKERLKKKKKHLSKAISVYKNEKNSKPHIFSMRTKL